MSCLRYLQRFQLSSTGRCTHPAVKVARQVEGMVGRRAAMCCARMVPCGDTTSLAVGVGALPPSRGPPRILLAACSPTFTCRCQTFGISLSLLQQHANDTRYATKTLA